MEVCSQGGGLGEPLAVWAITDTRGPSARSRERSARLSGECQVRLLGFYFPLQPWGKPPDPPLSAGLVHCKKEDPVQCV